MKCTITDVVSDVNCSWCKKKSNCLKTSIENTFFLNSNLCIKCFHRAIELRKRQETLAESGKQLAKQPSTPTG